MVEGGRLRRTSYLLIEPVPVVSAFVATVELVSSLEKFDTFARSLKGDEKSEGQAFLDHFFRALGHAGAIEAGATFEHRIAKKPGSSQLELLKGEEAVRRPGGKRYADLLWPERVLIEMKSRGQNLEKHFLLELNLALAAKEAACEKITAPGLPLPESDRAPFITTDCIHATEG